MNAAWWKVESLSESESKKLVARLQPLADALNGGDQCQPMDYLEHGMLQDMLSRRGLVLCQSWLQQYDLCVDVVIDLHDVKDGVIPRPRNMPVVLPRNGRFPRHIEWRSFSELYPAGAVSILMRSWSSGKPPQPESS